MAINDNPPVVDMTWEQDSNGNLYQVPKIAKNYMDYTSHVHASQGISSTAASPPGYGTYTYPNTYTGP